MSYAEAGTARPLRTRLAARFASITNRPAHDADPALDPDAGPDEETEEGADNQLDWVHIGLVAAGVAAGALIGVSAAILLAPERGAYTRRRLGRGVRSARYRLADAWQDLGDELHIAARRGRRRVRRVARDTGSAADLLRHRY